MIIFPVRVGSPNGNGQFFLGGEGNRTAQCNVYVALRRGCSVPAAE